MPDKVVYFDAVADIFVAVAVVLFSLLSLLLLLLLQLLLLQLLLLQLLLLQLLLLQLLMLSTFFSCCYRCCCCCCFCCCCCCCCCFCFCFCCYLTINYHILAYLSHGFQSWNLNKESGQPCFVFKLYCRPSQHLLLSTRSASLSGAAILSSIEFCLAANMFDRFLRFFYVLALK